MLKDTIPPVPIYTIKEIVIQDAAAMNGAPGRSGLEASPEVPLIIANPSTHPAADAPADGKAAEPKATLGEKLDGEPPRPRSRWTPPPLRTRTK